MGWRWSGQRRRQIQSLNGKHGFQHSSEQRGCLKATAGTFPHSALVYLCLSRGRLRKRLDSDDEQEGEIVFSKESAVTEGGPPSSPQVGTPGSPAAGREHTPQSNVKPVKERSRDDAAGATPPRLRLRLKVSGGRERNLGGDFSPLSISNAQREQNDGSARRRRRSADSFSPESCGNEEVRIAPLFAYLRSAIPSPTVACHSRYTSL